LMAVFTEILAKHHPQELYFLFASTGGHVNSGIVLYNFLRSLPIKITMHITWA
jgi:ATP-dependent protease ClpP protease subunit